MLCCTSVLCSDLQQGFGELLYAVLHICALVSSWTLGELFYAMLYICVVVCAQIYDPGLRRAALCCAADLCCHLCLDLQPGA